MFFKQQTPCDTKIINAEIDSVCAVVVTFFPDQGFDERLQILLPQVGMVVILDNTPEDSRVFRLKEYYENDARILVIENQANVGIAAALNQGLGVACERSYGWIITLDQDTKCYPDMLQTLTNVYEACKSRVAVIGGNYFDFRKKRLRVPSGEPNEFLEQKTVITAGSLINTHVAQALGGFREEYFIDQVDHEFCLRARAHGYHVYISRKPVMEHSIGGPNRPLIPLLGIAPPDHPPLRKYYIARNSIVLMMEYWKLEPVWCLHRMVNLLLECGSIMMLQNDSFAKLRAFFAGIVDGVCRRMGSCHNKLLSKFPRTSESPQIYFGEQ